LNNLTIWQNVGADVDNGLWAIYGARHGTFLTMLTEWEIPMFNGLTIILNYGMNIVKVKI
jgi:hypothetical protein